MSGCECIAGLSFHCSVLLGFAKSDLGKKNRRASKQCIYMYGVYASACVLDYQSQFANRFILITIIQRQAYACIYNIVLIKNMHGVKIRGDLVGSRRGPLAQV